MTKSFKKAAAIIYPVFLLIPLFFLPETLISGATKPMVFKQVEQWNHGDKGLYSEFGCPVIDKDGHVVIYSGKFGGRLITPDKVIPFAPWGKGPNEAIYVCTMFLYNDELALLQMEKKVKIFTKKDGTYKWKETKWLKNEYNPQFMRNGLFTKDKWFISGLKILKQKNGVFSDAAFLKVYNNEG
ncbi:MAG: hypothetical protein GY950_26550 [bacterium]|nr:hypothetical protein [bacterium]